MHRRCRENYPVFLFTAAINKKFPLILEMVAFKSSFKSIMDGEGRGKGSFVTS